MPKARGAKAKEVKGIVSPPGTRHGNKIKPSTTAAVGRKRGNRTLGPDEQVEGCAGKAAVRRSALHMLRRNEAMAERGLCSIAI